MLIALLGAKGAPGATTAALALGRGWPRQVVIADCDPAGGDMIPGMLAGRAGLDRGLLSFATATRHARGPAGGELMRHLLLLPETPGCCSSRACRTPGRKGRSTRPRGGG